MSGRPNTITADGLGGTFGEEIIGVTLEAGTAGQGEYSVIYDEDQNGIVDPYDAVFENAFSVDLLTPPPSLPAGLSELKVTWERQAHGWQTTRAGFQGVFQALETKGLSGALQDAFVFHPDDLGLWQTLTSSVRSVVLLNHPSDLVFLQTLDAAGHLDGRAADPPDPDFRQPSPPAADAPIEPLDSDPLRNAVLRVADNLRFESALEGGTASGR